MSKLFQTSLMGSLPRSSELMRAKRELKSSKISDEKFSEILKNDTLKAINFQLNHGIDIITSGEFARDNYSNFVASKLNGATMMSMADMGEYLDDRMAFDEILQILDVASLSIKNAICNGKISRALPLVVDEMKFLKSHTKNSIKATLPGPYLLTRSMWLEKLSGKFYENKSALGRDILKVLKEEIDEISALGVEILQFDEPVLTEVVFSKGKTRSFMCGALASKKDSKDELEFATSLIGEIVNFSKKAGIKTALHVCRGNWSKDESILLSGAYTPLVGLFEDVGADILALEFSTPRAGEMAAVLGSSKLRKSTIFGLGVINPRSDEIERVEGIVKKVKDAMKFVEKEQILLNPDCGFATFANRPVNSYEIISKKLNSLNLAKEKLRKIYG